MGHVKDAPYFEVPRWFPFADNGKLYVPQPLELSEPLRIEVGFPPIDTLIEPLDLRLTKFMVLEVVAGLILCVLFIGLASRVRGGAQARGRLSNLLEAMIVFMRDSVARPAIGKHEGDRFLPFLLTIFFFVLGCNLLGMLPWSGTPTGAFATTTALALITLATVVGAGMRKLGPVGYWIALVPHMDLEMKLGGINFEPVLKTLLIPLIFFIEVLGMLIKHFVLAVRLLANMFAGHIVLAVLVAFIAATWHSLWIWGVAPASIMGAVALSLLELFVAFLQAYIFAFLSALFIGMAVHPH
jgi:F-type H+-transporting ATPase subunit a